MGSTYNDSEQQSVKKTFAGERNKLAQMSAGQKADYIFTYYKFHIICTLLIICIIIWGIHHAMTYVKYEFFGIVINSQELDVSREDDIREYLKMEGHEGVSLESGLYSDESASGGYGNRLSVLMMAGQCDFIFTDEAGIEYLQSFFDDYDIEVRDISDSPIHEYFGLDENTKYLIMAGLSGNVDYLNSFSEMLDEIDSGSIE